LRDIHHFPALKSSEHQLQDLPKTLSRISYGQSERVFHQGIAHPCANVIKTSHHCYRPRPRETTVLFRRRHSRHSRQPWKHQKEPSVLRKLQLLNQRDPVTSQSWLHLNLTRAACRYGGIVGNAIVSDLCPHIRREESDVLFEALRTCILRRALIKHRSEHRAFLASIARS
jgi:hypothetical protein